MLVRKHNNNNMVRPLMRNQTKAIAASPSHVHALQKAALLAAIVTMLLATFISGAAAQAGSMLNNPEANAIYSQLMEDPTNRSLNLKYSTIMSRGGDYEAAIPPLERLLVNDPNNAWLMLQLGTLYQALNSKSMAATYLNQAMNEPTASSDVVKKAKNLLSHM